MTSKTSVTKNFLLYQ